MSTTLNTPHAHETRAGTKWRLDPAGSTAEFRVRHFWGLATVKGHFEHLDGRLEIEGDGQCRIELSIDAASLDTGNPKRDEHLRSAEFFDADRHPEVSFRSTRAADAGGGRLHVEGELEAAGQRVPVVLEAALDQLDDHLEIDAATTVDQRRLGMTWSPLGMARVPAALTVHARLRRLAPTGPNPPAERAVRA
jgi:polyisoprenoid-binding protein YceI